MGSDQRLFVRRSERAGNVAGHRHGSSSPFRTLTLCTCGGAINPAADLVTRRSLNTSAGYLRGGGAVPGCRCSNSVPFLSPGPAPATPPPIPGNRLAWIARGPRPHLAGHCLIRADRRRRMRGPMRVHAGHHHRHDLRAAAGRDNLRASCTCKYMIAHMDPEAVGKVTGGHSRRCKVPGPAPGAGRLGAHR
jgi:hypothetical protein